MEVRSLFGYAWLTHSPIVGTPVTPDPSHSLNLAFVLGGLFEVLGFQAGRLITPARLIHGCAEDRFGKRDELVTPPMLSSGTPDDAQTWGSLGR
jgi:hypothetical protein